MHTLVLLLTLISLVVATHVHCLNIAIVSSGEWEDLLAAKALVEAAKQRKHVSFVLVDGESGSECVQIIGRDSCVDVLCLRMKCIHDPPAFVTTARVGLTLKKFVPDVILASGYLEGSHKLSEYYKVPFLILAKTLPGDGIEDTALPSPFPTHEFRKTSLYDAVRSAAQVFFSELLNGGAFKSLLRLYGRHHVITQGIPGFDAHDTGCPNVHAVGFFQNDLQQYCQRMASVIRNWDPECWNNFIYANVAADSIAAALEMYNLLSRIANESSSCLLWYRKGNPATKPFLHGGSAFHTLYLTDHVYASPAFVLREHTPSVVLSNTVHGVLRNAILQEAPVVYIGEEEKYCDLVTSVGVGLCAKVSAPTEILNATKTLLNNTAVRERIRAVQRMGFVMGGAQKAMEIVELAVRLGPENTDFYCDAGLLASPYGYNGGVVIGLSFLLGVIICVISLGISFLRCEKKKW